MRSLDFFGRRRVWYGISLLIILAGVVTLVLPGAGLRPGIDFVGGSLLEARFERGDITTSEIRGALVPLGYGEPIVQQSAEDPHRFIIRTKVFSAEQREEVEEALREAVADFSVLRFSGIAGVIGREMTRKAFLAVAIAAGLMLVYITLRFELRFAVVAIVTLLHDVAITVAAFSLLGREVGSSFVAALLTVVGYSINDTIVVFDRIRETLKARAYGAGESGALINQSVAKTLTRSINTSLTTLLAIGAVLVLGGRTTRDFALALMIGMAAGTYSSIFIASPLWAGWRERTLRRYRRPDDAKAPAVREAAAPAATPAAPVASTAPVAPAAPDAPAASGGGGRSRPRPKPAGRGGKRGKGQGRKRRRR